MFIKILLSVWAIETIAFTLIVAIEFMGGDLN